MKAVVTSGDGSVSIADVEKPRIIEPTDVILKVTASAICGTDLHFIRTPILGPTIPLGHEFMGVIDEVGPGVHTFTVGQRVKSRMFVACGNCIACLTANQQQCPEYALFGGPKGDGSAPLPGGQAEYVRIPHADRTLTSVADWLSDANALLLTDTLPTAWESVVGTGQPAGKSFAVVGAGPVGQQIITIAYALGAATVYAVDLNEKRLESAAGLGAIPVPAQGDAGAEIVRLNGKGVDVAIDAVGSQAAINTAMAAVGPGGSVALVGALLGGNLTFAVTDLVRKRVNIYPILGNPYATEHLITAMLESGKLNFDGLIDREVPLDDAVSAYEAFGTRTVNKVILRP